jgi:hypothetical protein
MTLTINIYKINKEPFTIYTLPQKTQNDPTMFPSNDADLETDWDMFMVASWLLLKLSDNMS